MGETLEAVADEVLVGEAARQAGLGRAGVDGSKRIVRTGEGRDRRGIPPGQPTYRSQEASSTIHRTSSPNVRPT